MTVLEMSAAIGMVLAGPVFVVSGVRFLGRLRSEGSIHPGYAGRRGAQAIGSALWSMSGLLLAVTGIVFLVGEAVTSYVLLAFAVACFVGALLSFRWVELGTRR